MTPEERARKALDGHKRVNQWAYKSVAQAITEAEEAMKERCAMLMAYLGDHNAGKTLAAAIRALDK